MDDHRTFLAAVELDGVRREEIAQMLPGWTLVFRPEDEVTAADTAAAEVIFGNPSPALLAGAARLRWLQLSSAGADGYVGRLPEGAVLTTASGAYGPSIGEYMLCMSMALMLNLPLCEQQMRAQVWNRDIPVRHVAGSTALSVGFGDIGREFAKRYSALGGHVIGVRRTPGTLPPYADEQHTIGELDELLPRADLVAVSLPATAETDRLFGRSRFARMKRGAYFVNAGRGNCVVTDDLIAALRSGQLAGAALDVTDPEPLPPGHPLWSEPNVIITPHVAGRWQVTENYRRVCGIFEDNLRRYLAGGPLRNIADAGRGY